MSDSVFEVIPLHFDVPEHHLPLKEFMATASKTQDIIDAFNEAFFEGELQYEILVVPPKPGTFTTFLGIMLPVCAGVWTISQTDVGRGFVKGLTGREPASWAELAGQKIRARIGPKDDAVDADEEEAASHQGASMIVSEMAKGFMQKDFNELRKLGLSKDKFRDAYEARNDFYHACYRNPSIQALGFDDTDVFPIKRRDFPGYIVDLPPKDDEEDHDWVVDVQAIKVTSPNWDRDDASRGWKGRDSKGKETFFTIEDGEFWHRVKIEELHLHVVDHLKVQWAYVDDRGRRKHTRVLRVLEFNGDPVSEMLDDNELKTVLGRFGAPEAQNGDLFS